MWYLQEGWAEQGCKRAVAAVETKRLASRNSDDDLITVRSTASLSDAPHRYGVAHYHGAPPANQYKCPVHATA